MNIYCISGLGADESVFKYLEFPQGYTLQYISWIQPMPSETLEAYAARLSVQIDESNPFVLLGLSMGGMLAVEIAKLKYPELLILVSSVAKRSELRKIFLITAPFKIYKILSPSIFKNLSILKKFFGFYSKEHRNLLIKTIRNSDNNFISWALPAILNWQNTETPKTYIHLHGSSDNVLPIRLTKPTHVIKNGRHFMVVEQAKEISAILQKELPAL